ncbi:hypothetical protein K438DRAFT_461399 [Mycena galopus ATCC 62051]|nr:hypothetical protein K438DRAFT_461399 [Mycena galopus ATCC 62051]
MNAAVSVYKVVAYVVQAPLKNSIIAATALSTGTTALQTACQRRAHGSWPTTLGIPSQVTVPGGILETGSAASASTTRPAILQFTARPWAQRDPRRRSIVLLLFLAVYVCEGLAPGEELQAEQQVDIRRCENFDPEGEMRSARRTPRSRALMAMSRVSCSAGMSPSGVPCTICSSSLRTSSRVCGARVDLSMPSGSKEFACMNSPS